MYLAQLAWSWVRTFDRKVFAECLRNPMSACTTGTMDSPGTRRFHVRPSEIVSILSNIYVHIEKCTSMQGVALGCCTWQNRAVDTSVGGYLGVAGNCWVPRSTL